MNKEQKLRAGTCNSIPRILEEGKLELHEEWQWMNGDCSSGTSVLEEI